VFSSNVRFSDLRKLLLDLGFVEEMVPGNPAAHEPPAIVFGHAPSDWIFVFRTYRPEEKVSNADVFGVRSQLDWKGLLSEEAFDAAVRKASA
jgi:hypothetical protein